MKNRLGIIENPEAFQIAERRATAMAVQTVRSQVSGQFDADHLRAIHKHIFDDVYEWAGTMRSDEITLEGEQINVPRSLPDLGKGSTEFADSFKVAQGVEDVVHLAALEDAISPDPEIFADAATEVFAKLNEVHPFREGNGRTQREFLEQLAERAGHEMTFKGVTGLRMDDACIEASKGDTKELRRLIVESLDPDRVALRMDAVELFDKSVMKADEFWIETPAANARVRGDCISMGSDQFIVGTHNNTFIAVPAFSYPNEIKLGDKV